jgi:hypothetical protein
MKFVPLIISLATRFRWKIHQMDVKTVFIHGDLSKEIFMEYPHGFVTDSNLVCRLKKSLYGLKQAPRVSYAKIDSFFLRLGFKCCESNHRLHGIHTNRDTLIVVVYIDDLVITRNNIDLLEETTC